MFHKQKPKPSLVYYFGRERPMNLSWWCLLGYCKSFSWHCQWIRTFSFHLNTNECHQIENVFHFLWRFQTKRLLFASQGARKKNTFKRMPQKTTLGKWDIIMKIPTTPVVNNVTLDGATIEINACSHSLITFPENHENTLDPHVTLKKISM